MKKSILKRLPDIILTALLFISCNVQERTSEVSGHEKSWEPHRPLVHFTPEAKWMNDPNGMVFHNGEYHLFFQYYPDSTVWGPMHWGHAVSSDLVHWERLPIALYPDSLGYIFSGSAVIDKENTSGFGTKENPPLVAIFTYHSPEKEKAGRTDYQYQGVAYSADGETWKKYEHNPVLENQGVKDFRDPKVFYHRESESWVMILAVNDHVELWSSPDLKEWSKLSEFGTGYGAHGGVWECPDLFEMKVQGESQSKWVMIVSLNPGGPNGGSGTQYFVGNFDGKTFTPDSGKNTIKWLDYGPDNYAGVTWSNAPDGRRIFLGWMNNWAYAQQVPTESWRGAATIPRDLVLSRINNDLFVTSHVVPELERIAGQAKDFENIRISASYNLSEQGAGDADVSILRGSIEARDFSIQFANTLNEYIMVGYDSKNKRFFIDKSASGNIGFSEVFPTRVFAGRVSSSASINFTIVADVSSVEVFFDDGLTVMTSLFYPEEPLSVLSINASEPLTLYSLSVRPLDSIWQQSN